jgi:hypothetical protein
VWAVEPVLDALGKRKDKSYRLCVSLYGLIKKLLKEESQKSISTEIFSRNEKGNFSDEKRKLLQVMA